MTSCDVYLHYHELKEEFQDLIRIIKKMINVVLILRWVSLELR